MRNRKGFTMVELLVVLVIIAILAAVATPIYLANVKRSRASEAVSSMALIRQAQRDYNVGHNSYFDVVQEPTDGNVQNPLPLQVTNVNANTNPADAGADVDAGVTQYFSNQAFWVEAGSDLPVNGAFGSANTWATSQPPFPVDFVVAVDGSNTQVCDAGHTDNCATKGSEVDDDTGGNGYVLEMDNSGRTWVCYDWDGSNCGPLDDKWSIY